jgi:hypothetical protein
LDTLQVNAVVTKGARSKEIHSLEILRGKASPEIKKPEEEKKEKKSDEKSADKDKKSDDKDEKD